MNGTLEKAQGRFMEFISKVCDDFGLNQFIAQLYAVIYLNVLGFPTTASCEGHEDRGLAYPWIQFSTKEAVKSEKKAHTISKERDILVEKHNNNFQHPEVLSKSKELWAQNKKADTENRKLANKLFKLLEEFYSEREKDIWRMLIITKLGSSLRLRSHAGDSVQNLDIYKEEMEEK